MNKTILFICSSPFTVYNSLNYLFTLPSDVDADIFIFNKTPMMSKIAEKLIEEGVFRNVFLCDDYQGKCIKAKHLKNMIKMMKIVISPRNVLKKKLIIGDIDKLKKYDVVISQNYFFVLLLGKCLDGAKFYLIEDGIGNYDYRVSNPQARRIRFKLVDFLFYKNKLTSLVKAQLVYLPELVSSDRLMPILLPKMDMKNLGVYKRIFQYRTNPLYEEKCIVILGQGNIGEGRGGQYTLYELYDELILPQLAEKRVIYRYHPVESKGKYNNSCLMDEYNNLWEIQCGESITEEHILISCHSTALVMPKILYDVEPTLIFLFPMINNDIEEIKLTERYINGVRNKYRNPEKVCIVHSMDELKMVLQDIKLRK